MKYWLFVVVACCWACGERQTEAVQEICAAEVWDETQGGRGVLVAVVDSGVDWENDEFVRVDGSSVVVDAVNLTTDQLRDDLDDLIGHGSAVASIAAGPENGRGVVGVAREASILSIKVVPDGLQTVSPTKLEQAIDFAMTAGARVINFSLSAPAIPKSLQNKVREAYELGIFVVAIVGNESSGTDANALAGLYPEVFAVTGLRRDGVWGGANAVLVPSYALPASRICALDVLKGGTAEVSCDFTGTSFAAPAFSGAVALVLDRFPNLGPNCLREGLEETGVELELEVSDSTARTVDLQELIAYLATAPCAQ